MTHSGLKHIMHNMMLWRRDILYEAWRNSLTTFLVLSQPGRLSTRSVAVEMYRCRTSTLAHGAFSSFPIHSFIQTISKAPLQVHFYSEAFPTQHGNCIGVSRRGAHIFGTSSLNSLRLHANAAVYTPPCAEDILISTTVLKCIWLDQSDMSLCATLCESTQEALYHLSSYILARTTSVRIVILQQLTEALGIIVV